MSEQQTYLFHVKGMHCKSCVILIEDNLKDAPGVISVKADLGRCEVVVSGSLGNEPLKIAEELTPRIQQHGYTLSVEKEQKNKGWSDFMYAVPIALVFITGFILLQKAGLVNLVTTSNVSYGTAFIIGLIASVSTCLAVVGGLVLSMSANYAKEGSVWKPQTLFHIGRLVSFFVLGGVIGALGSSFHLGLTGNLILSIIVGVIMLILGINLLDIFHATKRLQFALPKVFAKHTISKAATATHALAPLLVGIGTFFLPCGFTQSMQVYTLTTGSFIKGALTMVTFALGTLPVLTLLSFSSFSIAQKSWKGVFFKTAGLVVIILALFNLISTLVVAGVINPLFNF
jgi:sulfite exporter TauE/SafE/copper chaperone CopZ